MSHILEKWVNLPKIIVCLPVKLLEAEFSHWIHSRQWDPFNGFKEGGARGGKRGSGKERGKLHLLTSKTVETLSSIFTCILFILLTHTHRNAWALRIWAWSWGAVYWIRYQRGKVVAQGARNCIEMRAMERWKEWGASWLNWGCWWESCDANLDTYI